MKNGTRYAPEVRERAVQCYNSPRLSEDLDFNAGFDFKPSDFDGLEVDIEKALQKSTKRTYK